MGIFHDYTEKRIATTLRCQAMSKKHLNAFRKQNPRYIENI